MSWRSWAVIGAALVAGAAAAALVLADGRASQPWVVVAVGLLVAWSFVGVGVLARERRPDSRLGALMYAVGFAWLLGGLTLSDAALPYTLGLALSGLWYAVLAHMLLAFPTGRLSRRAERLIVSLAYGVAVGGQLAAMPFFAPASSRDCPCPRNLLLVRRDDAAADVLVAVAQSLGVALTVAVAVLLLRRWRSAGLARRRALSPVLAAGAAVILLLSVFLALDTGGAPDSVVHGVLLVALLALAAVPGAFVVGLARARFFHAGTLNRLLASLGGDVRDALAGALHDRDLALLYWLPAAQRYVDADGRAAELPDGPARTATVVRRGERRVGAIVHAAGLLDDLELAARVTGATALAMENGALQVELRARVAELERTRADVVAAADAERRRLERDLHDGAQQRLVALRVTLDRLRERVERDPTGRQLVDQGRGELDDALADLRRLARGLHPALLSTRGLQAAVRSLADSAPLRVGLLALPASRLPEAVESAAYFVTAEAITNIAKHAQADLATIRMTVDGGALEIEINDDGRGGADPDGHGLQGLRARVAALDGRLTVEPSAGGGTRVRASIPVPRQRENGSRPFIP